MPRCTGHASSTWAGVLLTLLAMDWNHRRSFLSRNGSPNKDLERSYGVARTLLAGFEGCPVINSGALVATGLRENAVFWQVSALPTPTWNSEVGMHPETDPVFTGFSCTPKRLTAITLVSRQLGGRHHCAPNIWISLWTMNH